MPEIPEAPVPDSISKYTTLSQALQDTAGVELSVAEEALCVANSYVRDASGKKPNEVDYVPTISVNRAMVQVCDLLLLKLVNVTDISADGVSIPASQLVEHVDAIRKVYRSRILPVGSQ